MNHEVKQPTKPEKKNRDFEKELQELKSKITYPIVINQPEKREELTYYTDKRRTILTSGTFAI